MRTPTPGQFRQADAIFDAALDLAPEERDAFIDRACEGDPMLRSLVRRLLRALRRSGEFLMQPALDLAGPLLDAEGDFDDGPPVPIPARVGPYRILEELGRGGMGVVYLAVAEDDPAAEPVALKVVRDGSRVAGTLLRRFLAERHILSRLDHPHIARLLETGITPDGAPYFAMAHSAGGSLAERLANGPLTVPDALRIARQLAEALGAAHALGIVHRDVKPANVLFSASGAVQLTDFGVAKMLDQDSTKSGTLLGTPAYLAPEQLRGAGLDHRADLWALGVTLYEMLQGRRPFDGSSYAAILHAVLTVEPERLARGDGMPPALDALVQHLLRKDVGGRPEQTGDVVAALREIETNPAAVYRGRAAPLPDLTSTPSHRSRGASLVVLPFTNTSGNADDTPFADGLTDELISALSKVRGLRVTARTTAFALRGKGFDAKTVANMIGVTYLLEGSVRRDGDRLKVAAQLVNAAEGSVAWSESFDRQVRDIFAVQEELARAIAVALMSTLGPGEEPTVARNRDVTTYELYLKGRFFFERRTAADMTRAIEYFEQAVERDPGYAEAYAAITDARVLLVALCGRAPETELPRARASMAEALRLGPEIGVVRATHGNLLSAFEWQWKKAEAELRLAIELDPGYAIAWVYLAIVLQHAERCDEAIDVAQQALVLDPLSSGLNLTLGRAHLSAGRPAESLRPFRTALEIAPGFAFAHQQFGHALLLLGRQAEALEAFQRGATLGGPSERGTLAFGLARTGDRAAAERIVRELVEEEQGYLPPFGIAAGYSGLGNYDAAFDWLNRGAAGRAAQMNTIKVAPAFLALHEDPRWTALLQRMDLA